MKSNAVAEKLAEKLNKSKVAGSDAHSMHHMGQAGIITKGTTTEEILNAIKKGLIQVKGKPYQFGSYIHHSYSVVKNNLLPMATKF